MIGDDFKNYQSMKFVTFLSQFNNDIIDRWGNEDDYTWPLDRSMGVCVIAFQGGGVHGA
jgi:hypothetical protein